MNNEDIKLLLMDLSARLTYGVKIQKINEPESAYKLYSINTNTGELKFTTFEGDSLSMGDGGYLARVGKLRFKPYLRPMSSMTEKEKKEFDNFCVIDEFVWRGNSEIGYKNQAIIMSDAIDWLNAHHFDYRGLIERGLAFEAPEGMYN